MIDRINHAILKIPRTAKKAAAILVDIASCIVAMAISLYLRLGYLPLPTRPLVAATLASIFLSIPILWAMHVYRASFRHVAMNSVVIMGSGIAIYAILFSGIFTFYGFAGIPRTLGLIQPIILFLLIIGNRALVVRLFRHGDGRGAERASVLIYGAGSAGRQLASALRQGGEMKIAGYIDDDRRTIGQVIDGITVFSSKMMANVVDRLGISHIFLAIPSAPRRRRADIIESLRSLPVKVQTLPGMMDLAHGRVEIADLRDLQIEDLLGRGRVSPDHGLLDVNIRGKIVLVTGAGGSIGGELCRQILGLAPEALILVEHDEFALYQIHQELAARAAQEGSPAVIEPLLASVCDPRRMERILGQWHPTILFHAAAYKHVPLVEHNPIEGIRNNVFGTLTVATTALRLGVAHVVLISTDKAVRPTSVMGASKRLAEMILQALASEPGQTVFSMVRFGNVLGSSGSVVPLFRAQIRAGGPLTITDRRMTRYFMLIPEAAQLVIQAGAMARGGEVFLLDMGDPVRIHDLARNMIELSGLSVRDARNPDGEIEIHEIGLRPGEKMFEELLIDADASPTQHPLIRQARENFVAWPHLQPQLDALRAALAEQKGEEALDLLSSLIFESSEPIQLGRRTG